VQVVKLSVGVIGHPEILKIEGQFTQGSSSGRTLGESVDEIFEMDSSDWLGRTGFDTILSAPHPTLKGVSTEALAITNIILELPAINAARDGARPAGGRWH
jgi:hypothetical protein